MFDHGVIPIGQGVIINLCMMAELIVFTIYARDLSTPKQVKRLAWFFPPLVLILFIAPTTGPGMLFGEYLAKRLDFPTYAELQYIQVGNVFPRLDVLGILLWTFGAFFRATIYSQGILTILRENLSTAQFKKFATLVAAIVVILANIIAQERANLLSFLETTYPLIAIFMGIGIPAMYLTISALLRLRIKKKE
jgi:spore germination protein KB